MASIVLRWADPPREPRVVEVDRADVGTLVEYLRVPESEGGGFRQRRLADKLERAADSDVLELDIEQVQFIHNAICANPEIVGRYTGLRPLCDAATASLTGT